MGILGLAFSTAGSAEPDGTSSGPCRRQKQRPVRRWPRQRRRRHRRWVKRSRR